MSNPSPSTPDISPTAARLYDFFEPYAAYDMATRTLDDPNNPADYVKGFILASQLWLAHPDLLASTMDDLYSDGCPPAGGQIEALLNALATDDPNHV
jgi:hypothetical protein